MSEPDPAICWPAAVHALQNDIDESGAMASMEAMLGRVLEDDIADDPDGVYYARRAPLMLIDHEVGEPVELS